MRRSSFARFTFATALVLSLAACESSEERAEGHYQSALALLAEGDTARAFVEFRNVFDLDPDNLEARMTYAKALVETGDLGQAYSQFLRLVEQDPDNVEGRLTLAEMAFQSNNWEEFDRHSEVILELGSENPEVQAIAIAADFRAALIARDDGKASAAAQKAQELSKTLPDNSLLLRVTIEDHLKNGQYGSAVDKLDIALQQQPLNRDLYLQKLTVLNQLGDDDGVEGVLATMIDQFPGDLELQRSLVRLYMSRGEIDKAEGFLREISDPADGASPAYLGLIQLLLQERGPDAALAELNATLETSPDLTVLRNVRAGIDFEQGRRDKAINDLETLIAEAETPDDQVLNAKVSLARMLMSTGNEVGARRLIGETLEVDASQVEALKMRATWQIDADETDEAISTLRTALDQSPQDANAMTLMAQAYDRAGSKDLAREFLSSAVEASRNAPVEAMRYATVLMEEERYQAAESTLLAARRTDPSNVQVLQQLGQVYLRQRDLARTRQVIDTMRRLDTEQSKGAADALQVQLLSNQDGAAGAIEFLEQLAEEDNNLNAKIAVVRARLVAGDTQEALEYAQSILDEDPDNLALKYTLYSAQAAAGDTDAAIEGYKEILSIDPSSDTIWLELARLQTSKGRVDLARQAIEDGIKAIPTAPRLLWAKASYLERDGEYEQVIAIYEQLYEQQSGNVLIANNLASTLSSYRDDPESLERAFNVARRLRGLELPQFRDTYGWIMHLRGDNEEAKNYLEPAAAALPNDPIIQYRLGVVFEALGDTDRALVQYRKAVQLAGEIDTRPQIELARKALLDAANQ